MLDVSGNCEYDEAKQTAPLQSSACVIHSKHNQTVDIRYGKLMTSVIQESSQQMDGGFKSKRHDLEEEQKSI